MSAAELESLLQQAMGLDAASIGSSAIDSAVRSRSSACKLDDIGAYADLVRASAAELQALIEAVVVPETWFLRDREAFVELARVANEDWLPADPHGMLRILSLPCSTGEEPYSMAMTLLAAAFPANRYRIDAIDISSQALAHARRAVYGKNSFRGADFAFRERCFETTAAGSRLNDAVRREVYFQQGNLLAEDFLPGAQIYDVIFCRNLLIYFDRSGQDRAVEVLQRLLKPNGVLFVGPSESGLLLSHGFVSSRVPLAFALSRNGSGPYGAIAAPVQPRSAPLQVHEKRPARPKPHRAACPKIALEPLPAGAGLDEAFSLADRGRMAEAAMHCEEHRRTHGPSVQSFFLMGLIRAAAGNPDDAARYYRKALYLDPNHYDALVHLGLLLRTQGDAQGARVLDDRIRRLGRQKTAT